MVNLIIKSKIKDAVKETGTTEIKNIAEEVSDALNNKIKKIIEEAVKRAEANHRKTLHARDL